MSKHSVWVAALTIALASRTNAAASGCAGNLGPASNRASISLHLDKSRYSLGASMSLDAAIMNKSTKPVFLYGWISWGLGGGLVIWVRNARGQIVRPVLMDDTLLPPPPDNNDPKMFVQLQEQGDFFGTHRDLKVADLVTARGNTRCKLNIRVQFPAISLGQKCETFRSSGEKTEVCSRIRFRSKLFQNAELLKRLELVRFQPL